MRKNLIAVAIEVALGLTDYQRVTAADCRLFSKCHRQLFVIRGRTIGKTYAQFLQRQLNLSSGATLRFLQTKPGVGVIGYDKANGSDCGCKTTLFRDVITGELRVESVDFSCAPSPEAPKAFMAAYPDVRRGE